MCLAFPASVVKLHGDGNATVSLGGVRKTVSLALLDDVAEGDFVIVHTGYALGKLDPDAFAGGRMTLDAARARQAVDENVSGRMSVDPVTGAAGIIEIVDENMANATPKVKPTACNTMFG